MKVLFSKKGLKISCLCKHVHVYILLMEAKERTKRNSQHLSCSHRKSVWCGTAWRGVVWFGVVRFSEPLCCFFIFLFEVCSPKREMRGSDLLFFWWAC